MAPSSMSVLCLLVEENQEGTSRTWYIKTSWTQAAWKPVLYKRTLELHLQGKAESKKPAA